MAMQDNGSDAGSQGVGEGGTLQEEDVEAVEAFSNNNDDIEDSVTNLEESSLDIIDDIPQISSAVKQPLEKSQQKEAARSEEGDEEATTVSFQLT